MSSLGYSSASRKSRQASAYAEKMRAKQKRQTILVVGLCVALIAVLAWELPKEFKGSKHAAVATTPVITTPTPNNTQAAKTAFHALELQPAVDPFSTRASALEPAARDSETVPSGAHDPFATPSSPAAATAPTPPPTTTTTTASTTSPLPEQIVIGSPGSGRVAVHGWIVILASIPTGQGRAAAQKFATKAATAGIESTSILNSSHRRPLRGGYWVVYTGPYATLNEVSARAGRVHAQGYPTAYIRELIVYQ
jgi:hypothetical protein